MGQEQDGSLLASWISVSADLKVTKSHIGLYNPLEKSFNKLYTFSERTNIIQASVNRSRTLLAYVIKENKTNDTPSELVYKPFIVEVRDDATNDPHPMLIPAERQKQVMVQFLWRKQTTFEKNYQDKFLLFVHEESKFLLSYLIF